MTSNPTIFPLANETPAAPRTLSVAHHQLTLFVESPPLLTAMLTDIRSATRRVWLETYIFADDSFGRLIAQALNEKARQGIDVRLHYDALGCSATPQKIFDNLARAGVTLHAYHSYGEAFRRFRPFTLLNRRNHRKLLIIDDAIAYFGGMNITDTLEPLPSAPHRRHLQDVPPPPHGETSPTAPPHPSPALGWRDMHIRLHGPQQADLAHSFQRSWLLARHETATRESRRTARKSFRASLRQLSATADPHQESIRFFDSGPTLRYAVAGRVYARLLRRAHHSVILAMAYFLPIGSVMRNLLRAHRRGARIRIIVPGLSDVPVVQRATTYLYDRLLRRGLRIYERQNRMLHTKAMVVDDLYSVIGSANMDPRSIYFNLEFLAVIRSRPFANAVAELLRDEQKQSRRITRADTRALSLLQRLLNAGAWLFRWWM